MLCAHVQFTSECSDVAKQKINGIFVSTKFLRNKISITGITAVRFKNSLCTRSRLAINSSNAYGGRR